MQSVPFNVKLMRQSVHWLLWSNTAKFLLFTSSLGSQIVSALISNTAIVIIGLTATDSAIAVAQLKKRVALLADMIDLFLATNYWVFNADVVVKTETWSAVWTDVSLIFGEFSTIFNCFWASSSIQEIILIKQNVPTAQFKHTLRLSFLRQPTIFDYWHFLSMR